MRFPKSIHVSRSSKVFSNATERKQVVASPKCHIEPENDDFQKESPFPGFHVNQYPRMPKAETFRKKHLPLPSGCCDFFSSSLVFCNLKKRHRHVVVQLPLHFFVVEGLLWTGHDFPSLEKHTDFRTFPLRNLVAF